MVKFITNSKTIQNICLQNSDSFKVNYCTTLPYTKTHAKGSKTTLILHDLNINIHTYEHCWNCWDDDEKTDRSVRTEIITSFLERNNARVQIYFFIISTYQNKMLIVDFEQLTYFGVI